MHIPLSTHMSYVRPISAFLHYFRSLLPAPLRNKFAVTALVFAVWMLFFDRFSLLDQLRLKRALSGARDKIAFHQKEKEKAEEEFKATFTNDDAVKKLAREKYFMKNDNEDVFIIQDEESD